jgi:hypothetical protein
MDSIADLQNRPEMLRAAKAFRRRYAVARRWRATRLGVGLLIGTAGVVVVLFNDAVGEYVAAAAAAWLALSRTVLVARERRQQEAGARAQEVFDVQTFRLPWQDALVGPQPAPEDLSNWGRGQDEAGVRDWYPDTRPARYPVDVMICQRASLTWARQDHATYSSLLRWAVGIGVTLTVGLGLALDLTLSEYLLSLGLPVLPAALDVLEVADKNAELAESRGFLQRRADLLLESARTTAQAPAVADCRDLQDGVYCSRRLAGVPGWFYLLTRERRQRSMSEAAQENVAQLPQSLLRP